MERRAPASVAGWHIMRARRDGKAARPTTEMKRAAVSSVRGTRDSSAISYVNKRKLESTRKLETDLKTPGTNYFMLRLALLIAPLAVVDRANAACAPTSPVNNTTVICSGVTANQ